MSSSIVAALKKMAKKKGVKKITRMTSAEYRALLQEKSSSPSSSAKPEKFSFTCEVEVLGNGYKITLYGKHLSKNRVNGFGLQKRIAYKEAIKRASKECWLRNRSAFRNIQTFEKATVGYVFYNPSSRDSGNGSESIKPFQDTFSLPLPHTPGVFGFIVDDSRTYLKHVIPEVSEVKSKEYKIEAYLFKGWKHSNLDTYSAALTEV